MFRTFSVRKGKIKEKFEVRFRFQATRIPDGYDNLVVSVLKGETNHVLAQTPSTEVSRGSCQWKDTVTHEINLTYDTKTKSYETKNVRLVLSPGSIKINVVGEVTVNVAEYAQLGEGALDQKPFPLKYCKAGAGTILYTTVQCFKVNDLEAESSANQSTSQSGSHQDSGSNSRIASVKTPEPETSEANEVDSADIGFDPYKVGEDSEALGENDYKIEPEPSPAPEPVYTRSRSSGSIAPRQIFEQVSNSDRYSPSNSPPRLPSRTSRKSLEHTVMVPPKRTESVGDIQRAEGDPSQGWPRRTLSSDKIELKSAAIEANQKSVAASGKPGHVRTHSNTLPAKEALDEGKSAYVARGFMSPNLVGPIPHDFSPAGSASSSKAPQDKNTPTSNSPLSQNAPHSAGNPAAPEDSAVRGLRADLSAAEQALEELQAEKFDLQRNVRNQNREIESLRQQLADAMTSDKRAEIKIQNLSAERDRLKEKCDGLEGEHGLNEQEKDGHETLKWEAMEAKRIAQELEDELAFEKEQVQNLKGQVEKLQESSGQLQLAVQESEESIQRYKKDLEDLFETNKEQEAAIKKAQVSMQAKEAEWKERMMKVIAAHNELEDKLSAMESAAQEAEKSGNGPNVAQLLSENAELAGKVEELELEAQELTQESLELASKLSKAEKEIEAKNEAIEKLQSTGQSRGLLRGWGASSSSLKSSAEKEGSEQSEGTSDEVISLREQVADLQRQVAIAYSELDSGLSNDVQKLRNQLRVSTMAKDRAEEKLSVLETVEEKATSLELDLRAKRAEVKALRDSREKFETDLLQEMKELRNRKEDAEKQLDVANEQVVIMEVRVKEVENEKEQILGKMGDGFKARKNAEEAASKLAGEKMELSYRLQELLEKHAEATQKVAELESRLSAMSESGAEILALKTSLEKVAAERTSLEKSNRSLQEQKRLLNSRVQELELQLSAVQEEFEQSKFSTVGLSVEDSNESLEMELEELKAENRTAKKRVQELEAQSRSMRERMEALSLSEKEYAARESDMLKQKESVENLLQEALEAKKSLQSQTAGLQDRVTDLEKQVASSQASKRSAETRVLGLEGAIEKLESEVQEAQHGRRLASDKIAALEEQVSTLTVSQAPLLAKNSQLEKRVDELKREAEFLLRHVNEALSTKSVLEERLHTTLEELGELQYEQRGFEDTLNRVKDNAGSRIAELSNRASWLANELDKCQRENRELSARVSKAEEQVNLEQSEKRLSVERLQLEVEHLAKQVDSRDGDQSDSSVSGLFSPNLAQEARELRVQVGVLEDKLRRRETELMQEKLDNLDLKREIDQRDGVLVAEKASARDREAKLGQEIEQAKRAAMAASEAAREMERLRKERDFFSKQSEETKQELTSMAAKCERLQREMQAKMEDDLTGKLVDSLRAELLKTNTEKKNLEDQKLTMSARLKSAMDSLASLEDVRLKNKALEGENKSLLGRANECERLREEKEGLERQFVALQAKLDGMFPTGNHEESEKLATKAAAAMAEEASQLRMQNTELKRKISEQKSEIEALKAAEAGGTTVIRSASTGSNSAFGRGKMKGMISQKDRDVAKQFEEMKGKISSLELELHKKSQELGAAQSPAQSGDSSGNGSPAFLLAIPGKSSPMTPRESFKLQEQVRNLESEVKAMAASLDKARKEAGEKERENTLLRGKLGAGIEAEKLARKVSILEQELAGALEDSKLYKGQLENAFSSKSNVDLAAIQNLGDPDSIIRELKDYKKKFLEADDELDSTRRRLTDMSLKLAEVEAERQELQLQLRVTRNRQR